LSTFRVSVYTKANLNPLKFQKQRGHEEQFKSYIYICIGVISSPH